MFEHHLVGSFINTTYTIAFFNKGMFLQNGTNTRETANPYSSKFYCSENINSVNKNQKPTKSDQIWFVVVL